MSVVTLDSVIIAEYSLFQVPADQIISDPDLAVEFLGRVNRQLPPEFRVDQANLNKRLLNIRKRGDLPRLERNYNGRNPKQPR